MEEATRRPARQKRLGVALGVTSLLAAIASLYAGSRYGHYHEELRHLRIAGTPPPEWLTWRFADKWKTASDILAWVAFPLAAVSAFLRTQPLSTFALLLALLALLTTTAVI